MIQFTNLQQYDYCRDWEVCLFEEEVPRYDSDLFLLLLLKSEIKDQLQWLFFFPAEKKNRFLLIQLTVNFRIKKKGGRSLKNNSRPHFLKTFISYHSRYQLSNQDATVCHCCSMCKYLLSTWVFVKITALTWMLCCLWNATFPQGAVYDGHLMKYCLELSYLLTTN